MLVNHAKFETGITPSGIQETNCPVFASLMDIMGNERKWVILDLGPARAANLEVMSRLRCRLLLEDIHELVSALRGDNAEDKAALANWFEQWTPGVSPGSIDVVIAWDIFNYLNPDLCKAFIGLLAPLLKPGAYIYLLVYSQKDMSAQPIPYKIISDDRLQYQSRSKATRPSPRFNQTELKKFLPEFTVVKSVLLRNGIQEYLFRHIT
ncbi:MAG: methyltransferase domain-containing protein [Gammaproteobacteria bacterium]|jgi:hypothetical protein